MSSTAHKSFSAGKVRSFCKMPSWNWTDPSSSSKSVHHTNQNQNQNAHQFDSHSVNTVSFKAISLLLGRRRLTLDPSNKLFFPYEPGKQAKSAIRIKNTSKSNVAFKFQTTAPKSCYMRPPGGILTPGESIIATVFKFVEHPENNEKLVGQKSRVKFKIMSLKVKGEIEYASEMFDERKDQVMVEQILKVVFLDKESPSLAMEKLNKQLAEAEADAELEAVNKKFPEDTGPRIVGEGLVIDEWKERRERYLARQLVEGVELV